MGQCKVAVTLVNGDDTDDDDGGDYQELQKRNVNSEASKGK